MTAKERLALCYSLLIEHINQFTNEELKKYATSHLMAAGMPCPIELDWFPSDSEDNFFKQSKEHQGYWNQQPPIKYYLNKYGFRSDEFSEEECRESITFIGCSNTVGLGIHKEDTWTARVAKELNLREINLGICAGSTDSAFRVYNEWQPIHKSKITCFLLPPTNRMEIVDRGGNWLNIGHWSTKVKWLSDEMLVSLLDDTLNEVRVDRNTAAIKHIANETDSKLIILPYTEKIDLARDNLHGGKNTHKNMAKNFLEEINK